MIRIAFLCSFFLLSTACSTLPSGMAENSSGGITHILSGTKFPSSLNEHEIVDDAIKVELKRVRVRYTHRGYGSLWTPYLALGREEVSDAYSVENDLAQLTSKPNTKTLTKESVALKVGDKTLTYWIVKTQVERPPNEGAVLVSSDRTSVDYDIFLPGNEFVLELVATCDPSEQRYFDGDMKKTFSEFVTANAHMFK